MENDPVQQSLASKLEQNAINLSQLQEGITECFVLTNRQFLKSRLGKSTPTTEIDETTKSLVGQVFAENNVSSTFASLQDIRKACKVLDTQLSFESNPELLGHHQEIIDHLFDLAS